MRKCSLCFKEFSCWFTVRQKGECEGPYATPAEITTEINNRMDSRRITEQLDIFTGQAISEG